ncbi:MAG: glycosyltransferase [Lachnospiraceae bacterium]|nr:glycosyltransferase [Lachnospiraceae bacterium]
MRILWLCNIMLPMVARQLQREASNKEGWLSGLASVVLKRRAENDVELSVAFPMEGKLTGAEQLACPAGTVYKGSVAVGEGALTWYGFAEDVVNPHVYDRALEKQLRRIVQDFRPDLVHCFGTEYPHTLAMCRVFPDKRRILVGIQGLCKVYANAYFANLPESLTRSATPRDLAKRDDLRSQQRKFALRGEMEYEAIRLAGNVTGRTDWDRHYTGQWNPKARYFAMNETLRPDFYTDRWSPEGCEPHSIFLSQGDYPIKGLHYMLLALPAIRRAYPDVKVYVAGNSCVRDGNLVNRMKVSAYGKFLQELIRKYGLQDCVCFLGRLDVTQMKQRYLRSNLFVCCSSIENSPNSLGEAMILGVPCVSADVGGIRSIFTDGTDGILYRGYRSPDNSFDDVTDPGEQREELKKQAGALSAAVIRMFSDAERMQAYTEQARRHALVTHDPEHNYERLIEIYTEIVRGQEEPDSAPRFVFVSNYINHHQIPFCEAMVARLGRDFVFIQTQPMEEERVRMGWQTQETLPYVLYAYEEPERCADLIDTAAVVLYGGLDEECYISRRLQRGLPVIRYSERLYKEGQWKAVSPRGLVKKYRDHTQYRGQEVYLLCAGAYVPSDFHIVQAYPGKMLKWGYFPETKHYDVDRLLADKQPATILWAARFLDWKHPEAPLACAQYLKKRGIAFHMQIVGGGQMQPLVDRLMEEYGLADVVELVGYQTPEEVRRRMEQTDIYLATSDRKEGWGAVLNEAMNSGCAVVASHMMGAAPYLIRHGENGFVYEDGREGELFIYVEQLLQDRALTQRMGRAAVQTIVDEWNAETAAERLVAFCEAKAFLAPAHSLDRTEQETGIASSGPCSVAEVIGEKEMLWRIRENRI